jgi:hypothetical protein
MSILVEWNQLIVNVIIWLMGSFITLDIQGRLSLDTVNQRELSFG